MRQVEWLHRRTVRPRAAWVGTAATWADHAQAAAVWVVLAAVWLLVTAVTFHQSPVTHDATLRQMGFGIVLALLAARLLVVAPTTLTAGLTAALSAVLVFSIVWWWPQQEWVAVAGLSRGGVACLAALAIILFNWIPSRANVAT